MDSLPYVLLTVTFLLLVALLSVLMYRSQQSQTRLLMQMVRDRETTIQSLVNQLRSQDPQTLLALSAATLPQTFSDTDYIPMSDAAEAQLAGFGDDLTQEDVDAFGMGYFPGVSQS